MREGPHFTELILSKLSQPHDQPGLEQNSDFLPCGELLLTMLREWGAGQIFGIPGDFILPFFKVVEESGILPLYTLSHEPGLGFAADAAARFNKSIGVVAVTYGAGSLNLVNAIAGAYAEKSPVVVISGAPSIAERERGLLLHHQVRSLDGPMTIFQEVTCAQARLDDPTTAISEISRVLTQAVTQSLPVYIELPRDMVMGPVPVALQADGAVDVSCYGRGAKPVDAATEPSTILAVETCAAELVRRLSEAEKPVIMAGIEVRRYGVEAELANLALRLGVPVVTSFMGGGLLANTVVEPRGTYLGQAGDPVIAHLVETSDTLLMVGVIPSDTNFVAGGDRLDFSKAIQIFERSVRMGEVTHSPIPLPALLGAMSKLVGSGLVAVPPLRERVEPEIPLRDSRLCTGDVITAVNALFDEIGGPMPIASDTGDCLFAAVDMENAGIIGPGYYASMGFGVPAGIGIQAASGVRPLILVGDGAFQMTGWELGNCRRYGFDPIVLLFNNRSWAMLEAIQPGSSFNELDDWHFADMAPQLGGGGERVSTRHGLKAALTRAVAAKGQFYLIEIMLASHEISTTLNRFVEAVTGRQKSG